MRSQGKQKNPFFFLLSLLSVDILTSYKDRFFYKLDLYEYTSVIDH